jgi:hypothetical protein
MQEHKAKKFQGKLAAIQSRHVLRFYRLKYPENRAVLEKITLFIAWFGLNFRYG